jgi:hypothetical protein
MRLNIWQKQQCVIAQTSHVWPPVFGAVLWITVVNYFRCSQRKIKFPDRGPVHSYVCSRLSATKLFVGFFMKIGRADSYNKLHSKHEFRENWSSESHFTEGRKWISIRTFQIWPILVTFDVVVHIIPLSSYKVRENRCRKSHGYERKVKNCLVS